MVRAAFGEFTSLLDFCRKVDRRLVSRHDVQLLIKLGAFTFTGPSRAQLWRRNSSTRCLPTGSGQLRATRPVWSHSIEDDLASGAIRLLPSGHPRQSLRTSVLTWVF
jgi:hypothetical protein